MAKILVIDDSMLSRRMVSDIVVDEGHEVETANDGQQGLEKVQAWKPDCVVSDLLMPVMNGQEFLAHLRRSGDTTPVIIVTADIQTSSCQRCTELGVSAFLNKPIKKDELTQALQDALCVKVEV